MNILNQPVMVLNNAWQQIQPKTVREAFTAMCGGKDGNNPPALSIDQGFAVDENGNVNWNDMTYANAVGWEEWIKLPIRPYDLAVNTGRMVIRAPRIIVQSNYSKMPLLTKKANKENIRKRDAGICQYTGEFIGKNGNIDHVIPKHLGGKNTFENQVWCKIKINSEKGNKTNEEVGLTLIRKPVSPKAMPLNAAFTIAHHPSWVHFMTNVTEVRDHKNIV